MKKQTNKSWRLSLLAAMATILTLGAIGSTFAQGKMGKGSSLSSSASQNLRLNLMPNGFDVTNLQSNSLLAAKFNLVADYPKPDFSAMDKWFEVTKYNYNFEAFPLPQMTILIKILADNPPQHWKMKFSDADGVALEDSYLLFNNFSTKDPQWVHVYCPFESQMPKVKSIVVYREIE